MGKAPLVFIGLDALDPGLARGWADAGELPTLAGLLARGARGRVRNPFGLFVGALWTSFAAAQGPHRTRFHCWDEIAPDSYRWRLNPPEPELYEPFWQQLARAGRKVAAIDVPHARAGGGGALELFEWGCHDRHYGLHGAPEGLARRMAARFGLHPVLGLQPWRARHFAPDDAYARKGRFRTPAEDGRLTLALCEGAARKGGMLRGLWEEHDWDLFVAVFGESHAVGHQQWHLHDEGHGRFDAAARDAAGGDPVLRVYRAIDAEVGRLLAILPPAAAILVHLSHGMVAHNDGTHLLDALLARLDAAQTGKNGGRVRDAARPWVSALRRLADRIRLPNALRAPAARLILGSPTRARARRRFFAEPNNSVYGGIRFNLAGREPHGRVRPDELEGLIGELERDLLALKNIETGGPVVRALHRCDRHHPRDAADTMPDLFVEWERSAPIETISSRKIGRLHMPYTHWRTGDHESDGLLIACGAGFAAGAEMPAIDVEDIGPGIAARFGLKLDGVDGEAPEWLAGAGARILGGPSRSRACI